METPATTRSSASASSTTSRSCCGGALLAGEIKPGERIKVAELEKSFGVSHIPIREAVRRLETEGLIVALPQRAAVAAGVDLDDLGGPLRPAPDRRVRGDPALGRRDDRRAGRGVRGRARERSRPSPRITTRRGSGSSTATSTGRCSSRARARGSGACSSRSGSPRSATSGCSSPRRSTTRWPTTASCSCCCEQRDGARAAEDPAPPPRPHRARGAAGVHAPTDAARAPAEPMRAAIVSAYRRRPRPASAPSREPPRGRRSSSCSPPRSTRPTSRSRPGRFPAGSPPLPYVPGIEGVGRVVQSARFAPGTRVWASGRGLGVARDGAFAERFVVADEALVEVPEGAADVVAAAFGQVGLAGLDVALVARSRSVRARSCSCSARRAASARSRCRRRSCSAPAASSPSGATQRPARGARAALGADATVALEGDDFRGAPRGRGRRRAADARARPALGAAARGRGGRRRPGRADRPPRPVGGADRHARLRGSCAGSSSRSSATRTSPSRSTRSRRATRTWSGTRRGPASASTPRRCRSIASARRGRARRGGRDVKLVLVP